MQQVRRLATRWRSWLAPALLAAIVLGILGMHALNHHPAMAGDPGHASGHEASSTPASAPGAATDHPGSTGVGGHSTGHVMMLCGAMLLGAAVGLLLARGPRAVALQGVAAARLRHVLPALVPQRAGTGPPYVWKFSVVRC